jgi:hypothetical protein
MSVQRITSTTKATRTIAGTAEVTRTVNTPNGLTLVRQINATTRTMAVPANVTRSIGIMVTTGEKGDQGDPGPSGVSAWGGIGGTLASQIDLMNALNAKALEAHPHAVADVMGLQAALDGKQVAGAYAASVHSHITSDVTGLDAALASKAASVHTHLIADTAGLQAALDGKQVAGAYAAAAHTHAQADVTGLVTALAGKEPVIAAGTAAQYIKGDKSLGTLDKAAVGLGNVDNTNDADKPISSATAAALAGKAATAHSHVASHISDFAESVDDRVAALLVAGTNITLTYNDAANTLTLDTAGGGGGGGAWNAFTMTSAILCGQLEYRATIAAVGILVTDIIDLRFAPTTDADENEPEGIDLCLMNAQAGVDVITILMTFYQPMSGPIKLLWRKS